MKRRGFLWDNKTTQCCLLMNLLPWLSYPVLLPRKGRSSASKAHFGGWLWKLVTFFVRCSSDEAVACLTLSTSLPLPGTYSTWSLLSRPPQDLRPISFYMDFPVKKKMIRDFLTGQMFSLPPIHYPFYSSGFWSPTFQIPYISWLLAYGL